MAGTGSSIDGVRGERTCPRCQTYLFIVERGGERLDFCKRCGGIWFDETELEYILGQGSSVELLVKITDPLKGEGLQCPECREIMTAKRVYGIYIDQCVNCSGIWMDSGETEKVWEIDERSKHPIKNDVDDIDSRWFWEHFRVKYFGLEKPKEH